MDTLPVIEELDVVKDRGASLIAVCKIAMMHQFILQVTEEALRHKMGVPG